MFRQFLLSRVLWYGITITAVYFTVALLVPMHYIFPILNGLFIGVMVAVISVYWPMFWRAAFVWPFSRASHIAIGIGLLWVSMALSRGYAMYNRANYPEMVKFGQLLNNPVSGYIGVLAIISGVLHVTAACIDENGMMVRGKVFLGLCLLGGLALGVFTLYLQIRS